MSGRKMTIVARRPLLDQLQPAHPSFDGAITKIVWTRFEGISAICIDVSQENKLIIGDLNGNTVQSVHLEQGVVSAIANGRLAPLDLTLGPCGLIYVLDGINRRVHCIDRANNNTKKVLPVLMGKKHSSCRPSDLAYHKGKLYVSCGTCIHCVDIASASVSILTGQAYGCGRGFRDGDCKDALFGWICGLCVDQQGNLLLCDYSNTCIRAINLENHIVSTMFGNGQHHVRDGPTDECSICFPCIIVCDAAGNLLVSTLMDGVCKFDTRTRQLSKIEALGNGYRVFACAQDGTAYAATDHNYSTLVSIRGLGGVSVSWLMSEHLMPVLRFVLPGGIVRVLAEYAV